jgi:L-threonylcarbamoyladenylate synthase
MSDMKVRTEVLATDSAAALQVALERAAELLRAGQVVAVPTETVYGLAANAFDAGAVQKIFAAKGRPRHNPVIVHVASRKMIQRCVAHWPAEAEKLAQVFWPGPLTLVLRRSAAVPDVVTAGGETVAVRWPSHPFIRALIRLCGFPLAAPSANPSNALSPTTAQHVAQSLAGKISLVVDGGRSQVGIESTVVDVSKRPLRVLRPGMIHAESLRAALGGTQARLDAGVAATKDGEPLRSPGRLPKHYSPVAKLVIWSWRNEADLQRQISNSRFNISDCHVLAHRHIPMGLSPAQVSVIPHDPVAFARALYAELHRCDAEGARVIVVETVPDTPEWQGITDRLRRAAGGNGL